MVAGPQVAWPPHSWAPGRELGRQNRLTMTTSSYPVVALQCYTCHGPLASPAASPSLPAKPAKPCARPRPTLWGQVSQCGWTSGAPATTGQARSPLLLSLPLPPLSLSPLPLKGASPQPHLGGGVPGKSLPISKEPQCVSVHPCHGVGTLPVVGGRRRGHRIMEGL